MLLKQYITLVHTSILQSVGPCNLFGSVWSMFVYNIQTEHLESIGIYQSPLNVSVLFVSFSTFK